MNNDTKNIQGSSRVEDEDEPDEWDKRINKTGCAEENLALTLCHADKKDWRLCLPEMEAFKKCWAEHNNNQRTSTLDAKN
ncbi:uncharacterized protein SAPINGB_P001845 [Magnusiomyces paraingens]|uniref:CHCH domain-containing protein n=1 Tax=Magnusiomyces paraingens TaxID=2606893 RepID=A0A5E8BIJ5_9ASCO|nr:uncharacterized protein SAPINGB_P001845 [Saprochaete ingens]VVT48573.1 unnamed protein product [Saprochaete ingens]